MQIPLLNIQGEAAGTAELSDLVFGQPRNDALVHQAMVMYRLNRRQGTHSTKTRAQVSGGGRKPWPQKHTGRARQGSTRSPQWRHGGTAFGPKPRDHRREMPRRMRHQALKCVLSEKVRQGKLVLLDELRPPTPHTKEMIQILRALRVEGPALIVTREPEEDIIRSSRNIPKVWTLPVRLLNALELLRQDTVVMTLAAARDAEELWQAETPKPRPVAKGKAVAEAEVVDEAVAEAEVVDEAVAEAEVVDEAVAEAEVADVAEAEVVDEVVAEAEVTHDEGEASEEARS